MKRQLNGAPSNTKKRGKARKMDDTSEKADSPKAAKSPDETTVSSWTAEEDQFLQELVQTSSSSSKSISWMNVCKKVNKKGLSKLKRTIKECQSRYNALSEMRDQQIWTTNEEMILLCLLYVYGTAWQQHLDGIIQRSTKNVKMHLVDEIKSVITRVKGDAPKDFKKMDSIGKLKTYVFLVLFMAGLENNSEAVIEVSEELMIADLKEAECMNYAKNGMSIETKDALVCYVDNVMEKLQNSMIEKTPPGKNGRGGEDGGESSLNELFHQREEENRGMRRDIYLHILSPAVTGQNQYLISIYFLPN